MKRKSIAIALTGMLALPLWMSTASALEFYGQVRGSVDFSSNDDEVSDNEDSTLAFSSNASRFGFRGEEQVSDALTVTYQAETTVDLDSGGIDTAGRNTYVGLKGGFGEVRAGLHDTPYKLATSDIFGDTRADYNAIVGTIDSFTIFDRRANNSIHYLSQDMSGFRVQAAYILGIDAGDDDLPDAKDPDNTGLSLAGMYSQGPLTLSAAFETLFVEDGTIIGFAADDDATAFKLSAGWDFGQGTKVNAIFESIESGVVVGGTDIDRDAFYLSASHKMTDKTTLKAAIGMADEIDDVDDSGATHFALGISQQASKDTELYALVAITSNDDNAEYGLNGVGFPADGGDGPSISSVSFGINKAFSGKFM